MEQIVLYDLINLYCLHFTLPSKLVLFLLVRTRGAAIVGLVLNENLILDFLCLLLRLSHHLQDWSLVNLDKIFALGNRSLFSLHGSLKLGHYLSLVRINVCWFALRKNHLLASGAISGALQLL
jgi:hypothetical protein